MCVEVLNVCMRELVQAFVQLCSSKKDHEGETQLLSAKQGCKRQEECKCIHAAEKRQKV